MTDIRIPSHLLTTQENCVGANKAYWALKKAYHDLIHLREQFRAEKNYAAADSVRDVMKVLADAYSYRLGDIEDRSGA